MKWNPYFILSALYIMWNTIFISLKFIVWFKHVCLLKLLFYLFICNKYYCYKINCLLVVLSWSFLIWHHTLHWPHWNLSLNLSLSLGFEDACLPIVAFVWPLPIVKHCIVDVLLGFEDACLLVTAFHYFLLFIPKILHSWIIYMENIKQPKTF